MRKLLFVLISIGLTSFFSCDDGDIIDFNLDFEDEFQACEGVNDLVLFKTKNDPSESLSVLIPNFKIENMLAVESNDTLSIPSKSATFTYRTYSDESISGLFCNEVPVNVTIKKDESSSCNVNILTVLTEDDNDGIPAALEDINENGNLKDDDTDGDGLPNYIDVDDDGDNVLTKDENPDPNGDGDLSDAQDTDNNGIPDYLDNDDDGDNTLTRDEEKGTQDQNLGNDITNPDVGPDYLNPEVSDELPATKYRAHSFSKKYLVSVTINNPQFNGATITTLDFGVLTGSSEISASETIVPEFN